MTTMKKTWNKVSGIATAALAGGTALLISPMIALANGSTDATASSGSGTAINFSFPNPISGVNNIQDLIVKIIGAIITVLGPFVVIMFIYSGFLFVQASGNEEKIQKAKQTLMYTLIGAALILGAKGIALAISNTVSQF